LAALEKSDRLSSLGMLSASLSHDLQTPLHVLQLGASFLQAFTAELRDGERTPPEVVANVPYDEALERAAVLSDQVQSNARLISGMSARLREFLQKGSEEAGGFFSVNEAVREVTDSVRRFVGIYSDRFQVVLSPEVPQIYGRRIAILQVVLNLVRNAAAALRTREEAVSVLTDYEPESDSVRIRVSDEGRGLAPEHRDTVFKPFFSLGDSPDSTGMGLAICRQIVAVHGGTIQLDSELGLGTTFTVALPRDYRDA
jgi:signal transduction histidine kinase